MSFSNNIYYLSFLLSYYILFLILSCPPQLLHFLLRNNNNRGLLFPTLHLCLPSFPHGTYLFSRFLGYFRLHPQIYRSWIYKWKRICSVYLSGSGSPQSVHYYLVLSFLMHNLCFIFLYYAIATYYAIVYMYHIVIAHSSWKDIELFPFICHCEKKNNGLG